MNQNEDLYLTNTYSMAAVYELAACVVVIIGCAAAILFS